MKLLQSIATPAALSVSLPGSPMYEIQSSQDGVVGKFSSSLTLLLPHILLRESEVALSHFISCPLLLPFDDAPIYLCLNQSLSPKRSCHHHHHHHLAIHVAMAPPPIAAG